MEIKAIMNSVIRSVTPADKLGVAGRRFEEQNVSLLPVVADDGSVTGTVALRDVRAARGQALGDDEVIKTVMNEGAMHCLDTDDVSALAEKAEQAGVQHVVIMNEQGQVQGIADLGPYQTGGIHHNDGDHNDGDHNDVDHNAADHDEGGQDSPNARDQALKESFPASDPISPP